MVLTAGSLADRLGRRRLFAIGLSIFTALVARLRAAAGHRRSLDAARAVQGIGAAIMFAVSLALLAHAFPSAKERAGALAAYGATIGASFAIGPLVGGALTSGLDWQWIFLVNLPIGIACLVITRLFVRSRATRHPHGIDWPGQITLTAGLFLLVLALLRGNERGLGLARDRRRAGGRRRRADRVRRDRAPRARADAAARPVPQPARSPARRSPRSRSRRRSSPSSSTSTLYLQQVLGLSAIEAGLVYLPGTMLMLLRLRRDARSSARSSRRAR